MTHTTSAARRHAAAAIDRDSGDRLGPARIALVFGVVLLTAAVLVLPARAQAPVEPLHTRPVRVERGDSLWSLAQAHSVTGLGASETAGLIREMNGLDGAGLAVGQVLLVPAEGDTGRVALAGP